MKIDHQRPVSSYKIKRWIATNAIKDSRMIMTVLKRMRMVRRAMVIHGQMR